MSRFRKLVLLVLLVVLVGTMLLTWGSIGSAAILLCLVLSGAAILYQHFITNNDRNDYWLE